MLLTHALTQTMRYLGLLPHALDFYGKNDWASKKFVFKDKVSLALTLPAAC